MKKNATLFFAMFMLSISGSLSAEGAYEDTSIGPIQAVKFSSMVGTDMLIIESQKKEYIISMDRLMNTKDLSAAELFRLETVREGVFDALKICHKMALSMLDRSSAYSLVLGMVHFREGSPSTFRANIFNQIVEEPKRTERSHLSCGIRKR